MTNFESPSPSQTPQPPEPGKQPVGAPGRRCIASFGDYLAAQQLVDRMSDAGFPVEYVRIVGDGVRTVEQVTGRMTNGRAALAGAASGAWFGLLIGLLFGLFTTGPVAWVWVIVGTTIIGAVWGAIFGFVAHWSSGGQRDFSSVRTLEAQRYDVYVDEEHAAEAARFVQG
ncbi:general stress protein [Nocardia donostiensis]|uniref:general stress protein n=1 Tax=Nocardia donostiensis TaxID=1538463 RepID=UPI001FEA5512|nr:general stress protein [Nocardia donostiensis]